MLTLLRTLRLTLMRMRMLRLGGGGSVLVAAPDSVHSSELMFALRLMLRTGLGFRLNR